jgi:general secretion pathway protein K
MKLSFQNNRGRGFALIIAMLAIFVLSIMAAMLAFSMKVETRLAATANDDQRMIWLARCAVEHARCGLAEEAKVPNQPFRSMNQWWATGQAGPEETNDLMLVDYPQSWQFADGSSFSYSIVDLERYLNINTAPTPVLQQTLTAMGVDADDISVVSDSIQDWVQAGDSPRAAGAKNDYYQSLNPPYNCKEAPMDDKTELLLVRGITEHPEIYYGTPSDVPQKLQHQLGFANSADQASPPNYLFGLKDVVTPFSTGQININTADTNVLQCIPGVDAATAASIEAYRESTDNGTDDPSFRNVSQLGAAGISQAIASQMGRYCTVMSYTFEVNITTVIGPDTGSYHAILFQNGSNIHVVGFWADK